MIKPIASVYKEAFLTEISSIIGVFGLYKPHKNIMNTMHPDSFGTAPSANQTQVGGDHYKAMSVQPWDAMESWMSSEQFKGYLRGNAIKYLSRCDSKGGVEDLKKARHYLDKLIELDSKT